MDSLRPIIGYSDTSLSHTYNFDMSAPGAINVSPGSMPNIIAWGDQKGPSNLDLFPLLTPVMNKLIKNSTSGRERLFLPNTIGNSWPKKNLIIEQLQRSLNVWKKRQLKGIRKVTF